MDGKLVVSDNGKTPSIVLHHGDLEESCKNLDFTQECYFILEFSTNKQTTFTLTLTNNYNPI